MWKGNHFIGSAGRLLIQGKGCSSATTTGQPGFTLTEALTRARVNRIPPAESAPYNRLGLYDPLRPAIVGRHLDTIESSASYGDVVFSPDGKRVVYVVGDSEGKRVVVDGNRVGRPSSAIHSLRFSPDGRRVAYVRSPDSRKSEDGRKVSFGARWKRELWWVTMAVR